MAHQSLLRGFAAVLLATTLMVPYAHPAYCDMGMHVQTAGADAVTLPTHHHAGSHHQQRAPCHDQTSCGVVTVAPVLASQVVLPTPTTVAYLAPVPGETFANTPTDPNTPPPKV